MSDLATIVVLTYNGEKYLIELLESLYNQSYRPLEIVIADDASQDKTVDIIKQWKSERSNSEFTIKIIENKKNQGRGLNRLSVINYITGKFIFISDQDDIWLSNKVEKQILFLKQNPDCFSVSCDRKLINDHGNIIIDSEQEYRNTLHKNKIELVEALDFKNSNNYPANCICFRNDDLNKVFSISENVKELDYFFRAMLAAKGKIGFINESLILYRIHSNNLSKNYFIEVSNKWRDIYNTKLKLDKKYNKIYEIDDKLIVEELRNRFSIEVKAYYPYRKRRFPHYNALITLFKAVIKRKKGVFLIYGK